MGPTSTSSVAAPTGPQRRGARDRVACRRTETLDRARPHTRQTRCTPYARRAEIDWAPLLASTSAEPKGPGLQVVHLRVEQLVLHEQLADLGVQSLVLLIPGIRRAALQPRLARGQELVTPLGGPRRRDAQRPRYRLEILTPQQAEYRLAFAPGRKSPLPVWFGGRSGRPPGSLRRRRTLIVLPHLDTPPARTLSQSSVQENPGAQEARAISCLVSEAHASKSQGFGASVTAPTSGNARLSECPSDRLAARS